MAFIKARMVETGKAFGNAAFTAQRYEEAVTAFSECISIDPDNHILYR